MMYKDKTHFSIIGTMSGTSMDGLDIVFAEFSQNEHNAWDFSLKFSSTFQFEEQQREQLQGAKEMTALQVSILDVELGQWMGEKIASFMKTNKLSANDVDLIASHGLTVFHQPEKGLSLQIGSGTAIALTTGVPVLNQFRSKDVLLGGQGAPLVPIGDALLLASKADAFLNIGGFCNITFLKGNEVKAFDICPGNLPLNYLVRKKGLAFDENGKLARSGDISFFLLDMLNNLDFYRQSGPKSLGAEWLEQEFLPLIKTDKDIETNLRTVVEHLAIQIGEVVNRYAAEKVYCTGGGTHNRFLIERIQHYCSAELIVPEREIIDYKEALVFAFLGALYLTSSNNCLSSVTGANRNSIGGVYHRPD